MRYLNQTNSTIEELVQETINSGVFLCDKCGLCCTHLDRNTLYRELDRGDGICIHLDTSKMLCKVYQSRSLICNVLEAYSLFKDTLTYEEYLTLNYQSCKKIREE